MQAKAILERELAGIEHAVELIETILAMEQRTPRRRRALGADIYDEYVMKAGHALDRLASEEGTRQ